VDFRYPGEAADRDEAVRAFDIARRMREKLLPLFEQPTQTGPDPASTSGQP
jgi:hypothetical protein